MQNELNEKEKDMPESEEGKSGPENEESRNRPESEEVRIWKRRRNWILFWSIIAVAILIAILFQ